ncbi:hypothetical protein [Neotabrizicola shimadae]|uniref:Uncharacterized protein n=1 Tax=Neotabrizicola shimadae TaxID=2807096 RepID=A0A8G1EEX6_9RHOB|nr:hypothetical protein [Neotabrizicola shimadae]QYZ71219.1 hypothetical protein JO391_06860 [Neotabrizicola shimadae]
MPAILGIPWLLGLIGVGAAGGIALGTYEAGAQAGKGLREVMPLAVGAAALVYLMGRK